MFVGEAAIVPKFRGESFGCRQLRETRTLIFPARTGHVGDFACNYPGCAQSGLQMGPVAALWAYRRGCTRWSLAV